MAKKRKNIWLYIAVFVLLATLVVFAIVKGDRKPKGIQVEIDKVALRSIYETVGGSGKIFPETEVKISSDVSGEIVELYVEEGDSVLLGQILAKIDPDTYESYVERAEASLNNAKASLATSRAQIQSSRAAKEQILAQIENARTIHSRNTKLHSENVISDAELEQSQSTLKGLEANLKAANANIKSAEQSSKGAEYSVKSFEASLKETRTNLGRTLIEAPIGGVISSLSVEEGERVVGTIQMAGTEMMRIANLQSMEVQVEVSENDILRVEQWDSTEIEVDAYLDRTFYGVVTEIANSASNTTGMGNSLNSDQVTNFIVKVRISPMSYVDILNSTGSFPFRPGMSASVDIFTQLEEDVVCVPIQAVTTRIEEEENKNTTDDEFKEVVFVVNADTVSMVEVKTGIQDDEFIYVISGVDTSQTIVKGPYSAVSKKLESGSQVREKKEREKDKKD